MESGFTFLEVGQRVDGRRGTRVRTGQVDDGCLT